MSTPSHRRSAALRLFAGASLAAMAASGAAFAGAPQTTAQTTNGPSTNVPTTQVPGSGSPTTETQQTATSVPVATPDGAVQEVVVTGFRASLRSAIAQKRTSDQIVESISAEDIGKLPDNSIAESIARLPGITAQRLDGRDSVISIRGLSPDFSTTLLNGREQVSTGDTRSAEFDQYPSELISGVVVYKTPEAGLVGQGLAGTIDLRTIRPLDYKKRIFSLNARGEVDKLDDRSNSGYRVSGTYVDQFANDTIGVSIGVAREESPNVSNRWRDYGFASGPGGLLVPGGIVTTAYAGQLERTGVAATVQYRPNSKFSSTLDVYYSDFFNSQDSHGLEQGLFYGGSPPSSTGKPGPTLRPGYTSDGKFITAGTYDNIYTVQRNDLLSNQANLLSTGWNGVYEDGPWKFVGDVSYSGVRRRTHILETYSGTGRNFAGTPDTESFAVPEDGYVTVSEPANHADPSRIFLTSPQGWGGDVVPGGQDGYLNIPLVRDQITAYRASALRQVGAFGVKSVEFGANYTHRFKSFTPDQYFLGLNANLADPTHATSVAFPSSVLGDPLSLDYNGAGDVINADPTALLSSGLYSFLRNPNADVAASAWKLTEKVVSFWLKANIDQPIFGNDLTGNVGIQVVSTDQSSVGTSATGAPIAVSVQVRGGDTYIEPLPSISLNYRLGADDVIRFGTARTLARPRTDDLRAALNFNYDTNKAGSTNLAQSPFSGSGGNPTLKPWIADSADLSLEHYLGKEAYVSLALYYKYLESYIFNQQVLSDFSTYPVLSGPQPLLRQGFISAPANGSGGNLYGAEFTAVLPITALTSFVDKAGTFTPYVDGFGLSGSVSYTESTITQNGVATALPGLSKYVGNGTAYYEKNGLSARVSVRYRSKFLGEVSGFGNARQTQEAAPETIVDAQIGYEFKEGRLKGLGLLVQGNNLTDEPFVTFENGDPRRIIGYQSYGQRILFGVSYKY